MRYPNEGRSKKSEDRQARNLWFTKTMANLAKANELYEELNGEPSDTDLEFIRSSLE